MLNKIIIICLFFRYLQFTMCVRMWLSDYLIEHIRCKKKKTSTKSKTLQETSFPLKMTLKTFHRHRRPLCLFLVSILLSEYFCPTQVVGLEWELSRNRGLLNNDGKEDIYVKSVAINGRIAGTFIICRQFLLLEVSTCSQFHQR